MKIKTIRYGHTHTLPDHRNDRLDIEARLEDWEDPDETYLVLKKKVREMLGAEFDGDSREELKKEFFDLRNKVFEERQRLSDIKGELLEYQNKAREVLTGIGIARKLKTVDGFHSQSATNHLHRFIDSITALFSSFEEEEESGESNDTDRDSEETAPGCCGGCDEDEDYSDDEDEGDPFD